MQEPTDSVRSRVRHAARSTASFVGLLSTRPFLVARPSPIILRLLFRVESVCATLLV
jgi:hypothetical protein